MILDNTLIKIFTQIKDEVKAKYKVDYSNEEIQSIVEVQIEATKVGIAKGVSINWHRFCKFVFTNKYARKIETTQLKYDLENNEDLLPEERNKILYDKIIENAQEQKSYIANTKNRMDTQATVDSLLKTNNVNNVTVKRFICLTN